MPIVVAILGVILVVLGVLFFVMEPKSDTATPDTTEINRPANEEVEELTLNTEPSIDDDKEPTAEPTEVNEASTGAVSLTGAGSYLTPARTRHDLSVTLTLQNGVVTDADVTYDNGDGYSNPNQERFDKAYKTEVVGKSLSEISLSRVGGASLTTEAFNEAVAAIRTQS